MSSIGSPTPLSGPKIDDEIIESRLRWVDCHYTTRENGRRSIHTKYQQQPGRAEKCNNGCKPAIVAWPPPSKRILLNPQSLPNGARTSNSKVAIVFLKRKNIWGVEHDKVPERPFASEVKCCPCTLCLIVPHIIPLDMSHTWTCRQERCVRLHRDKLSNRGRSVGREKGSCTYVLGQMTPAIELCKIISHLTGRQATCGEPMPEDKWHFLRTVL